MPLAKYKTRSEQAVMSIAYRRYLLAMLMVVLALNFVDRLAIGLLLEDIKRDLKLTDTQLGIVTGIAFALFYSVMGIPIARWADRGNRVTIITLTTGLWSCAVALCGAAGGFFQLLLIRVGVAVGEAGCIPPAHSLIADHFTRDERPRAVAIYMLGAPLSLIIGYFCAGWLNEIYGWRMTFLMISVPGLLLTPMIWLTLREPRVQRDFAAVTASHSEPNMRVVLATLSRNRTFRALLICWSVAAFFSNGITQWKPAFFVRSYGLDTGQIGTWFALIYGFGGLLGTYLGGEIASRLADRNERRQLQIVALAYILFAVVSAAMYTVTTLSLTFLLMAFAAVGGNIVIAPLFATIQGLAPSSMRATSIAIVYLAANLIGMGLGPLFVGLLSDGLQQWVGIESLRYSLLSLCPGYFICSVYLWRASATVRRDLAHAILADPQRP